MIDIPVDKYGTLTTIGDEITENGETKYQIDIDTGDNLGISEQLQADSGALFCTVTYEIELSSNFAESMDPQIGKLPGITGVAGNEGFGGKPSTGTGWSFRIGFGPPTGGGQIPLGAYIYHMGQATDFGDFFFVKNVDRASRFFISTNAVVNDVGIASLACVVDDTFITGDFQVTNGIPRIGYWHDVFHGGTQAAQVDQNVKISKLVVT